MDRKKASSSSSTGKMKFVPKAPKSKRKPRTTPSQPTRNAAAEDEDALPPRFQTKQHSKRDANEKKPSQPGIVIREPDETMILHDETMDDSTSEEGTYEEPWDYDNTNYPTSLPMRKPHSGHPDILDATEFGDAANNENFDERKVNAAETLGLQDEREQETLLVFQFPKPLPVLKNWGQLAKGRIGKLVMYKSGTVKLKIGEVLYDVYPGTGNPCEQAVAMDRRRKVCCLLGQVKKRAVVSVDAISILDASTEK